MMKKSRKYTIIIAVCLILFIGIIGVLISMHSIDKQTSSNTIELSDIITSVDITDTGKNIYLQIHTKEYDALLNVSTVISKELNIDDICNKLKKGETIFFRIDSYTLNTFKDMSFGNIVSLRTINEKIFSLDDYNNYMHKAALPARTAGVIFSIVFLLISVYVAMLLKRSK